MFHRSKDSPETQAWRTMKDLEEFYHYRFPPKMGFLRPNTGSEGNFHWTCKAMGAYILAKAEYFFAAEVIINGGVLGRIDLLDLTRGIVIEFQSGLTEAIKAEKKQKYARNRIIRDYIFIDLDKLPRDHDKLEKALTDKILNVNSD
jgi:hypothetical protein